MDTSSVSQIKFSTQIDLQLKFKFFLNFYKYIILYFLIFVNKFDEKFFYFHAAEVLPLYLLYYLLTITEQLYYCFQDCPLIRDGMLWCLRKVSNFHPRGLQPRAQTS